MPPLDELHFGYILGIVHISRATKRRAGTVDNHIDVWIPFPEPVPCAVPLWQAVRGTPVAEAIESRANWPVGKEGKVPYETSHAIHAARRSLRVLRRITHPATVVRAWKGCLSKQGARVTRPRWWTSNRARPRELPLAPPMAPLFNGVEFEGGGGSLVGTVTEKKSDKPIDERWGEVRFPDQPMHSPFGGAKEQAIVSDVPVARNVSKSRAPPRISLRLVQVPLLVV